jgi:hypothetical protein
MCNCYERITKDLKGKYNDDGYLEDFGLCMPSNAEMYEASYTNTTFKNENKRKISIPHKYCPFCGKEYIEDKNVYPFFKESEIVCNCAECKAGMGLAGKGSCFLFGNAKDKNCNKFEKEIK